MISSPEKESQKALKIKRALSNGMEQTIREAEEDDFHGLCFVNLVDFDALWGTEGIRKDMPGSWNVLMKSWEFFWTP